MAVLVTRGSTTMTGAVFITDSVTFQTLAEDGMVVCDIGADEEDDIGNLHVLVGAGRAVGAEGKLVAGDGTGHAERGVAIEVAGAEAKLDEFAEGVELFGEELAGADDAEGIVAVLLLDWRQIFRSWCRVLRPMRRARACRSCVGAVVSRGRGRRECGVR